MLLKNKGKFNGVVLFICFAQKCHIKAYYNENN
jgi:hypothetical protein